MQNPRILPPKAPYEYRDGDEGGREGEARNEGKSFGRAGKLLQPGEKGRKEEIEGTNLFLLHQHGGSTRGVQEREMEDEVFRQHPRLTV